MSPLSEGYSQKRKAKKRPELPRSSSFQPDAEHDTADLDEPTEAEIGPGKDAVPESPVESESDADGYTHTAQTSITENSRTLGADDVPDEVKISAIIEEFGDIAGLIEPPPDQTEPEQERMLAEAKGSLFK
jgi:sterol 3beta-glucosyltransferase